MHLGQVCEAGHGQAAAGSAVRAWAQTVPYPPHADNWRPAAGVRGGPRAGGGGVPGLARGERAGRADHRGRRRPEQRPRRQGARARRVDRHVRLAVRRHRRGARRAAARAHRCVLLAGADFVDGRLRRCAGARFVPVRRCVRLAACSHRRCAWREPEQAWHLGLITDAQAGTCEVLRSAWEQARVLSAWLCAGKPPRMRCPDASPARQAASARRGRR